MNPLSKEKFDSIDNIGFYLDDENITKVLQIVLTSHPGFEAKTIEGYSIRRDSGENGSFFLENIEIGKLASAYTEGLDHIILKIAAEVQGIDEEQILTWHVMRSEE